MDHTRLTPLVAGDRGAAGEPAVHSRSHRFRPARPVARPRTHANDDGVFVHRLGSRPAAVLLAALVVAVLVAWLTLLVVGLTAAGPGAAPPLPPSPAGAS